MNEESKLRIAMIIELCVVIVMTVSFLYQTEKVFQFSSLFLAMMSLGFAFEKHLQLKDMVEND